MIKKLIITTTLSLLVFTGCSNKVPKISDGDNNNVSDSTAITGDAVSIDESSSHAGASSNSSADGFQSVYFGFGNYGVSSSMQEIISYNASNALKSSGKIKIEGNCDEFGTDEYNYALGIKRAKSVKDAMGSQGFDTSRVLLVSYGESSPICSSQTDNCYAQNRRVDLRISR